VVGQSHRFVLRLPSALRDRIAEAAALYRRSMNSEIVARLEHSLSGVPKHRTESGIEPPFFRQLETTFRRDLSDDEDRLVRLFRRLSNRQRRALFDLLT